MKIEQIQRDIKTKTKAGVSNTKNKIYNVIDKHLRAYYNEYYSKEYIRTYQLLHSLVKEGSGTHASVYFDAGALSYQTGLVMTKSGDYWNATWGADEVFDTALTKGTHGGYISGSPIWEDSKTELGDVYELIVNELKKAGLPVHG